MNYFRLTISVILLSILCSCDYLNVVPDNVATVENAFTLRNEAEKYLFTVYSYLPEHANFEKNPGMITGDEVWFYYPPGPFNSEAWEIARGNQNVVDPYLNYWSGREHGDPLFQGIRDANIFLENIGQVENIEEFERDRWIAEVKFLKAYYHFWLLRMYGPIPLIKENIPISGGVEEVKVSREPVDEAINYIVSLIDEAAEDLPEVIQSEVTELGRITKPAALAIKARILVMAASPLFNGNSDYSGFTTEDGTPFFNSEFDLQKWQRAADAAREAIELCHSVGMELYRFNPEISTYDISDSTRVKLSIRGSITEEWNSEVIWGNANSMAGNIQHIATPKMFPTLPNGNGTRGMYAPPLRMAELFYTENGVPITEDITWNYGERYSLRTATADDRYYIKEGYQTAALHFDREPRFYANLGFDGSIWYGHGRLNDEDTWYLEAKAGQTVARSELDNYSITGYFTKKIVNYRNVVSETNYSVESYSWPVIRLADLYLLYAEALNEMNGASDEVYQWINRVRERANLQSVEDSWSNYSTQPNKYNTKEGLREIIHQERLIELAFEGQRIWDLKRWKTASEIMNEQIRGWDIEQEDAVSYYQPQILFDQTFKLRDYFWPIREQELIINTELTQNPGW